VRYASSPHLLLPFTLGFTFRFSYRWLHSCQAARLAQGGIRPGAVSDASDPSDKSDKSDKSNQSDQSDEFGKSDAPPLPSVSPSQGDTVGRFGDPDASVAEVAHLYHSLPPTGDTDGRHVAKPQHGIAPEKP